MVHRPGDLEEAHPGGSPFNVAVGLGRLAVPVELAAQVAADAFGDLVLERLRSSGSTFANLDPLAERTSSAVATIDPAGAASYDFDLRWDPRLIDLPAGVSALHVGSLGAVVGPGANAVAELVDRAVEAGTVVSYDPNVRLAVEPDPRSWRSAMDRFGGRASVVKMSDEDAEVLFPDQSHEEVVSRLAAAGRLAVVTRGSGGALLAAGVHVVETVVPQVVVVDTIGAGDSFMGAMLAWLAQRSWPRVARLTAEELTAIGTYATAAAAVTCSRPGADPPWLHEVRAPE